MGTVINEALLSAGAVRLGDLGKADAKGKGENSQDVVIFQWIDSIWDPLKEALKKDLYVSNIAQEKLLKAQKDTLKVISPLFSSTDDQNEKKGIKTIAWSAILVLLIALLTRWMFSN